MTPAPTDNAAPIRETATSDRPITDLRSAEEIGCRGYRRSGSIVERRPVHRLVRRERSKELGDLGVLEGSDLADIGAGCAPLERCGAGHEHASRLERSELELGNVLGVGLG